MTQFARIPARAANARDLGAQDLRVFIALATHADGEGRAYPSLARIASLTGVARKNVPRSIARLEKAELIRHRRQKGETGAWANSVYQIVWEDPTEVGLPNGAASPEVSGGGAEARDDIARDAPTIKKEGPPRQSDEKSRKIAEYMLAIWRAECGDVLSVPRSLDRDRVSACQARYQDSFGRDLAQWRALCREIIESPFCYPHARR